VSEDPTSPDAVARSMGLGGDLPPAPARDAARASVAAAPSATGLEARPEPAWWRRGPARTLIVTAAVLWSGYVFSWGDVEEESRAVAAVAGGLVLGLLTLIVGALWWGFRQLIGRPRPFGRTAFNYGLVAAVFAIGILGADEFLG
jgi:hypothetical protein